MNLFGKWSPMVGVLGSLVGVVFFAQRAVQLLKARKHRRLLARPRATAGRPVDKNPG